MDLWRDSLCLALSNRAAHVAWSAFTEADWAALGQLARREGVAPLLYHALEAQGWPDGLPASLRRDLRSAYYETASRNLLISNELARLAAIFGGATGSAHGQTSVAGPAAIVLKGAALAVTAYPRIALRPAGDIDLLVAPDRLAAGVAAMQALGYGEANPEMAEGLNQAVGHHLRLCRAEMGSIAIELHWSLVGGESDTRTPSLDWFWQQTTPFAGLSRVPQRGLSRVPQRGLSRVPQRGLLTLTPTAHLLYLAAHLILQHSAAESRLLWLYDLHLLAGGRAGAIEWDEMIRRAHAYQWTPALHAALAGAQACFATALPPGLLDALREMSGGQTSDRLAGPARPHTTRSLATLHELRSLTRTARLRALWGIFLPSPTYMRWRYQPQPAWLWPLTYVRRWLSMAGDGLRTLAMLARRR